MRDVIGRKMESSALTFRHLGTGDVASVVPEIIAASGLQQSAISVGRLSMAFGIDGHPPQPAPQHNLAAGTFDMGDGHQLKVKIDGKSPENFLRDKASSMIWGWIIGAAIIGVMVLTLVGVGIYVYVVARSSGAGGAGGAAKAASAATWDGKSTFECGGNDVVALTGVTATAGVRAAGNCQLTLTNVNIMANALGGHVGALAHRRSMRQDLGSRVPDVRLPENRDPDHQRDDDRRPAPRHERLLRDRLHARTLVDAAAVTALRTPGFALDGKGCAASAAFDEHPSS